MFKKAKCIELYDAGVVFSTEPEGYASTVLLGRAEWEERPVYKIPLFDLSVMDKFAFNFKGKGPFSS